MYIDSNSKKIFEEYKNKNFDEIYFDNKFKFLKGIKEKNDEKKNSININDVSDNSDFVSDSFYEYHKKELDELNKKEEENSVCEIIDSSVENISIDINCDNNNDDNNNNNGNVIELDETISLNSNSSNDDEQKDKMNCNSNNINNIQLNNKTYKTPKKINCSEKNKIIDLKLEMKFNSIKERLKKELLQRKRSFQSNDINIDNKQKKLDEEVIDISSQHSINESSNFIPLDNEYAQQFSTNSNY
jgi:hypothetical protein